MRGAVGSVTSATVASAFTGRPRCRVRTRGGESSSWTLRAITVKPMPARATSNRAPARGGGSSRPRAGSSTAKKRPPAKRGGSDAARRPAPRKNQSTLGGSAVRAAAGVWGLLARGVGGLARSVARPDEAEPLGPEHRRDGVGLAVLGLAIVLGAAAWTHGIGPAGAVLDSGVRFAIGALTAVLPVVLLLVALRLLRHPPRPEARGRLLIGWTCVVAAVVGITHVTGPDIDAGDRSGAGGLLGWAVGSPLTSGVGSVVAVLLLVLLAAFGLLVVTATPVHQVPERLRGWLDHQLGRDGDEDYDEYDDLYEDEDEEPAPRSRRGRKTPAAAVQDTLDTGAIDLRAMDEAP